MATKVCIRIKPYQPKRGFVFADMVSIGDNGDACAAYGTIDMLLSMAKERGYEILNAQEILLWLQDNVTFQPHAR